ncbi:methyl-accepting chemotaxis sensory transducer with Pas/Pac sensor [Halogranum gelatinilyticum]|uniref:Methyl-accepting chemotaxis sensory transducer with Pas/Pac sensor n=1 Tax=Halogranum gelatinilyticum TaxID=660521 RepID=A0A1G9SIW3_9EURY|nr:methyl-accepting chemotaxis protein [Halogranum gelatinilyticum]SDM35237.1 methyl-accepting chemotaxis sensory transducer with Pas/Pac sensor [Halogranum gelatinilyticum]
MFGIFAALRSEQPADGQTNSRANVIETTDVEAVPDVGRLGSLTGESVVESILAGLDSPIFVVDDEGYFTHSNQACRDLFNREPGELLGDCLFDYGEADNSVMREVLDTGQAVQDLEDTVVVDGDEVPVSRNVFPLFGGSGEVVGAIEFNEDITERLAMEAREEQLERYQSAVVGELEESLDRLSHGDFTIDPEIPEPDADFPAIRNVHREFAGMARDLTIAVENTRELLDETRGRADELAVISEEIATQTEETMASAEQIGESSEQVTRLAEKQTDEADVAEDSVSELSASIEEITASTQEIDVRANEAAETAVKGSEEAESAIERMEAAIEASEENIATVQSLESRMEAIDEMTEMIAKIADQTSLLALNANIEAARANTDGAGFKVVADEVKSLAEESKEAVADIANIVDDLRVGIGETSDAIETSNREVKAGAEAVNDVVQRIDDITDAIGETNQGLSEIANATENQATNAEVVLDVVGDLAARSTTVSGQMQEVSAGVAQQTTAISQVSGIADEVSDISDEMADGLSHFELEAASADGRNGSQSAGSAWTDGGFEFGTDR